MKVYPKLKTRVALFAFLFTALFALPAAGAAPKPVYDWTTITGGMVVDIATDSAGNLYLAGMYGDTVDFGAAFGSADVKHASSHGETFLTRVNADDSYGWTRVFPTGYGAVAEANGIAVDLEGNIYVTGAFGGTVDFAADFGETDVKAEAMDPDGPDDYANDSRDIFVTRINGDGSYGWTRRIGVADAFPEFHEVDQGEGITIGPAGNVLVTGRVNFRNSNLESVEINFAEDFGGTDWRGGGAAFVTSIGPDGSYGWTRRLIGQGRKIATDEAGNVFVAGNFSGWTVDFAADLGGSDIKHGAGYWDSYVTRINADRSYGWTRTIDGPLYEMLYGLAVDSEGNVICTGEFGDLDDIGGDPVTVDFAADFGGSDPKTSIGSTDIFVLRINNDGSYGWTRRIGGTDMESPNDLSLDAQDNIYFVGAFEGTVNFAKDFGKNDQVSSAGGGDAFISRINHDGSYGWTRRMGGTSTSIFGDFAYCALFAAGGLYVAGGFSGSVDFAEDFGDEDVLTGGDLTVYLTRIVIPAHRGSSQDDNATTGGCVLSPSPAGAGPALWTILPAAILLAFRSARRRGRRPGL